MEKKTLPLEYRGYNYLNKQVYFKGGLPGLLVMILFSVLAVSFIILINFTNVLVTGITIIALVLAMIKWAKKIAIENAKGDRDYMKSMTAWGKSPRQIRDNGLLKKMLDKNEGKLNI